MTPSSPNVVPSYTSFLPQTGSGMATPESVAAAYAAGAAKPVAAPASTAMVQGMPITEDALRAMLAKIMPAAQPNQQFGPYTMENGLLGYNYRGGANRSGGGGFGGGYGSSGGGGYSTSSRGGSSSSAGYGGGMGGRSK